MSFTDLYCSPAEREMVATGLWDAWEVSRSVNGTMSNLWRLMARDETPGEKYLAEGLSHLLVGMARDLAEHPCPLPNCDGCEQARAFWWKLASNLPDDTRKVLYRTLDETGTTQPEYPG